MNLEQYTELYIQWGLMLYMFVMLVVAIGGPMAAYGESRITRFLGFVLMVSCLAVLVVGARISFELPFEEIERFSDEYLEHVEDPREPKRWTLWGNVFAAGFAVISLVITIVLLSITIHTRYTR